MARKGTESYKTERRQKKKDKSKVLFALREIEKKMLCAGNEDIRDFQSARSYVQPCY
jgi:hypothetical protein